MTTPKTSLEVMAREYNVLIDEMFERLAQLRLRYSDDRECTETMNKLLKELSLPRMRLRTVQ